MVGPVIHPLIIVAFIDVSSHLKAVLKSLTRDSRIRHDLGRDLPTSLQTRRCSMIIRARQLISETKCYCA
jgi:hypothetical protein